MKIYFYPGVQGTKVTEACMVIPILLQAYLGYNVHRLTERIDQAGNLRIGFKRSEV
jgi:hypothetical protein